jgi:ribA/ribD-fused uncharacterized protein
MSEEEFHLFWGGTFSQWLPADMEIDGVTYSCCEQYMMAEKARLFKDEEALEKIMSTRNPREQKAIGRKVKNFVKEEWEKIQMNGKPFCWNVVYKANEAKFTQNPGLLEDLVRTKGKTLVEASPYDKIWGIGRGEEDSRALSRNTWDGLNWLGEVCTELREALIWKLDIKSDDDLDNVKGYH